MKPHGPIPPGFAPAPDGTLAIAGEGVETLIARAGGTPLFVYDRAAIASRIRAFREAMPREVALHYAVKANPYPPLLEWLVSFVDGFDLASGGELSALDQAGGLVLPVSFAGPGKRDAELAQAIEGGVTINLESEREARRALDIAADLGITPRLAVRVNPSFALKGAGMKMGGLASQFGVDADRVPTLVRSLLAERADWRGLHIYAGSQLLHADPLIDAQRRTVALAAQVAEAVGQAPPEVNLGGGFGIPYASTDTALDIDAVGRGLAETLSSVDPSLNGTRFFIELGRWLVGEAGVYLTRVIDVKDSGGRRFAITDGGLQHMLAATGNFGQLLRRNYPIANASRFADEVREEITVTGCLCTPLDLLGDEVELPPVSPGDVIAIFCAGAYGLTASPTAFLGQPAAREMLV